MTDEKDTTQPVPSVIKPRSGGKTTQEPTESRESSAVTSQPQEKRAKRSPFRALITALMIMMLGFMGGVGGYYVANELWETGATNNSSSEKQPIQPSNESPSSSTSTGKSDKKSSSDVATPAEIYERVSPAVVHIDARVVEQQSFFGIPQGERESAGTGSGFVIDTKGHVVTNAHVVENARSLTVNFGDEASVEAKIIGMDKSSDIAVLKIDPKASGLKGDLPTVPFGDSSKLTVGDPVLAIGNPFGLDRTLTTGVVSALQRTIPSLNDFSIADVIQTDAAVNPGNSGGPLLNMDGEVIGVNSQIQSKSGGFDGIAFAVPSLRVKDVADALIKDGKVSYAWLGVSGGELTPELKKRLKVDVETGVVIAEVTPNSPAAAAGVKGAPDQQTPGGDVFISFNGEKLTSMRQLAKLVDESKPGDKVTVVLLRDGKKETVKIELGSRPDRVTSNVPGGRGE